MTARSIGPYSLVTQLPITSGELVSPREMAWLFDRGLAGLFADFALLKSDSPGARVRAYESIVMGREIPLPPIEERVVPFETPSPAPEPGGLDFFSIQHGPEVPVPDRLCRWACLLGCLAVGVRLAEGVFEFAYEAPNDPSAWSFGEITEVATFDQTDFSAVPGGLFCPRIFGPTKDFECNCGKYKGMKLRGKRCEVCGVEVTRSRSRRRRFAHVTLAAPVVPRHLRVIVEALLGEDGPRLLATLEEDGGLELENILRSIDVSACLDTMDSDDPRRPYVEALATSGTPAPDLMWKVVPVLPPELRPLVRLDDGRWASSDITDFYFLLIDRNVRCRDVASKGDSTVVVEERRALGRAVDELLFGRPPTKDERALRGIFDFALAALDPPAMKVDFSGRAPVVIDPSRTRVGVPALMLEELSTPASYGVLEHRGLCKTIKGAKELLASEPALRREVSGSVFTDWPVVFSAGEGFVGAMIEPVDGDLIVLTSSVSTRLGNPAEVTLHLPLNDCALDEAQALIAEEPPLRARPTEGPMARLASTPLLRLDRLVLLALRRASDPLTSPSLAWLAGGLPSEPDPLV